MKKITWKYLGNACRDKFKIHCKNEDKESFWITHDGLNHEVQGPRREYRHCNCYNYTTKTNNFYLNWILGLVDGTESTHHVPTVTLFTGYQKNCMPAFSKFALIGIIKIFFFWQDILLKNDTRRLPCAQCRGSAEWQIMFLSGVWLWHFRGHSVFTSQPSISTFQMLFLKLSFHIPSYTNRSVFLHVFYLMWHHGLTMDSITTIPANTSTFLKDSVSRICDAGNLTAKGQQFERQALEFGITVKMFFVVSSLQNHTRSRQKYIWLDLFTCQWKTVA